MIALALAVMLSLQESPPAVADPARQLKEHWMKLIEHSRDGRKEELQAAIAAMQFTREELVQLFGEKRAARAWPGYSESWTKTVLTQAPADLIARCKRGAWNDVDVW